MKSPEPTVKTCRQRPPHVPCNSVNRMLLFAWIALPLLLANFNSVAADDLASQEQQAFTTAVNAVAKSVVQIRTIGGLDRVGKTLLSTGPTTGVIVSSDGYIVSSAFNFAGKPNSILVKLASGKQLAAKLVGRDSNRMLVLLKVQAEQPLPVPVAAQTTNTQVGQWAIAVGRTFQSEQVDVSVGIVSALKRMYGRVLQTDANVSVANYGGPLVDISGNVLGILVPMSPQPSGGEDAEVAGTSFYDSGIGFAVPLEHIFGILERWKDQTDLRPGKLGIGLQNGDAHVTPPKITSVWRESPAAEAGWQADDLITAVNGVEVATQAQLRFQIVPKYADDALQVTLQRDGKPIESEVTLTGKLAPYRHPFLGVLTGQAVEEDNHTGALILLVWPGSPAGKAGLKVGDKIVKIEDAKVRSLIDFRKQILSMHPAQSAKLVVEREGQELSIEAELSTAPEDLLSAADLADFYTQGAAKAEQQQELKKLKVPEFEQAAQYYRPTLEEDQQPGLILYLGDGNEEKDQKIAKQWQTTCDRDGMVLLVAPPKPKASWKSDDLSYLQQLSRLAVQQLEVDRRRMIVVGQEKAGQLAYGLAMSGRAGFAGVVSINAPLPRALKPRNASPNNRLAVLIIESQDGGFAPLIRRDLQTLRAAGYPAVRLVRPADSAGEIELDPATRSSISRWALGLLCL